MMCDQTKIRLLVSCALILCLDAACQEKDSEALETAPPPAALSDTISKADMVKLLLAIEDLRAEIAELREHVDLYLGGLVTELQKENEVLREEVRRLYATRGGALLPRPGAAAIGDMLGEPFVGAHFEPSELAADETPPAPDPFDYVIVAEWGRTPEEAKSLGPTVSSLRGMICAVPPGCLDEDLLALGRSLRREFKDYNNINIEVFDDGQAARDYAAGKRAGVAGRRVMSVSKFPAEGRDVILLIHGETITEHPPEASAE